MGQTQGVLKIPANVAETRYLTFLEKQKLTDETRKQIEEVYAKLLDQWRNAEGEYKSVGAQSKGVQLLERQPFDFRDYVVIFSSACINANIFRLMKKQAAKKFIYKIGYNCLYVNQSNPTFELFKNVEPIESFRYVEIVGEHMFYMMYVPPEDWDVFATNYNPKNFEGSDEFKIPPDLQRLYELLIIEDYNEFRPNYFYEEPEGIIEMGLWFGEKSEVYIYKVKVFPETKAKFYDSIKNRRELYEEMDALIKKLHGNGFIVDVGDNTIYLPAKSTTMKQLSTQRDVIQAEKLYRFTPDGPNAKRIYDSPPEEPAKKQTCYIVSGPWSDDED